MLVDTAQGQANVAELNASLSGNEKAFQANAVAASASLTRTEQLLVVRNELKLQTAQVTAALKSENAVLVEQRALASQSASAQAQLSGSIKLQEEAILRLLVEQRQLAIATAQNNVALKGYTGALAENTAVATTNAAAQTEVAVAETEVAVASEVSTGSMVRVGVAISHLDGLAVHGGRSLGHLAEAFSTMSFGQLALIAGAAILIGYLISLFHHTEEQIKLDREQITLDLERSLAMQTGNLYTAERARVLRDTSAMTSTLTKASQELLVAIADEKDAVRGSTTVYKDAAAATDNWGLKIAILAKGMITEVKDTDAATASRLEFQKKLYEEITARINVAARTGETRAALEAEMRAVLGDTQAMRDLTAALDEGALAQARFKAGQGVIGQTRTKVAQEAAAEGVTLTHTEAVRRFNKEIAAQGAEVVKLAAETELAEKNQKAFTETHKSGGGAARSYANELVNLRKKAEESEAALLGDSFARREAAIQADIKAEREHLVINKRDRDAANAAIDRDQKARLGKLSNDRIEAEQNVMVEIAKMHIAAGEYEFQNKKQMMELDIALRSQALKKEFGDTTRTAELIDLYKRAKEEEYEKWYLEMWGKTTKEHLATERQFMDTLDAERMKRDKKVLDDFVKTETTIIKRIGEIARGLHLDLHLATPAQLEQLRRLDAQLEKMGIDVKRVDQIFGATSRSVAELEKRIKVLGDLTPAQMDKLEQKISLVRDSFASLFDAVGAGFEAMISGSESFGKAFLRSILSALGQIAASWGSFYVTLGVAELFTPGMHHAGVVHIAQGGALIALGGILAGVSGLISSSGSSSGSGGGGGGSSAATSVTSTARDRAIQPSLLDVPTSARSSYDSWVDRAFARRSDQEAINRRNALQADSGPVTLILQLSQPGTSDFLAGKKVVTLDNVRGNKAHILRQLGKGIQ